MLKKETSYLRCTLLQIIGKKKEYIKLSSPELKDYYCRRDEHGKRRELEKPCDNCICCEKSLTYGKSTNK